VAASSSTKIKVLGRIIVRHDDDDDDDDENKILYSKPPPNHCSQSCLSRMGTTTLVVI